jgi:tetratricopeptide (TPR) repeat protein
MGLTSYANWLRKQHDPDPARAAALREEAARVTELALVHAEQREEVLLAHCNLSSIRLEQQRFQEALDEAEAALVLKSDFAGALSLKGRALFGLGRFAEAEAALSAVVDIAYDPSSGRAAWDVRRRVDEVPVHLVLARIRGTDGRHAEALASYDAVLASVPGHPLALRGRVDSLRALERWPELVRALEEAAAGTPDPRPFEHQLAWYLSVSADPTLRDGARALALARALGGDAPDAHPLTASVYAAALAETGDLARALTVVEGALERARLAGGEGFLPQLEGQQADYRAGRPTREGAGG